MLNVATKCPECIHFEICRLGKAYVEYAVKLDDIDYDGVEAEVILKCKHYYPKVTSAIR